MDNLYTKKQISEIINQEANKLLLEISVKSTKRFVGFLTQLSKKAKPDGKDIGELGQQLKLLRLDAPIGGKRMGDLKKVGTDGFKDAKNYDTTELSNLSNFLNDAQRMLSNLDLSNAAPVMKKRVQQQLETIKIRKREVDRITKGIEKSKKRAAKTATDATKKTDAAKAATKKADAKAPKKVGSRKGLSTGRKVAIAGGAAAAAATGAMLAKGDSVVDPADADEKEKKKDSPEEKRRRRKNLKVGKATRTRIAHETIKNPEGPSGSVKQFQQILKDAGYDLGSYGVDGDYGTATVDAVLKYQEDNGLKVDGIVGPNTWGKMSEKAKEKPEKKDTTDGEKIEPIDVGQQKADEALKTALEGPNKIKHPSVRQALKEKKFQEIFHAYTRAKRGTNLKMQERALNKFFPGRNVSGAENIKGSKASKEDKKDIEQTSRLMMTQIGFIKVVQRAPEGRGYVSVFGATPEGKIKAVVTAARMLDKMVYEPNFFVVNARKNQQEDYLDDPEIPKVHAVAAIREKIDPILGTDTKKVAESKNYDLNFDKWSKLW